MQDCSLDSLMFSDLVPGQSPQAKQVTVFIAGWAVWMQQVALDGLNISLCDQKPKEFRRFATSRAAIVQSIPLRQSE